LEWVQIDIINEVNVSVIPPQSVDGISGKDADVFEGFIIDDIHLPSGEYFLRVRAFDGENEKSEFVEIIIIEAPRKLLRTYLVSSPTATTSRVDSLQNTTLTTLSTVDVTYDVSASNSYHGELVIGGMESGDLVILGGTDMDQTAFYSGQGNETESWYNDGIFSREQLKYYLSRVDGLVDIRRQNGSPIASFETTSNLRPFHLGATEQAVIVEERTFSGDQTYISAYFASTGFLNESFAIEGQLTKILALGNTAYLFGNDEDGAAIYSYSVGSGTVNTVVEFVDETLRDAIFYSGPEASELVVLAFQNRTQVLNLGSPTQIFPEWEWMQGGEELDFEDISGRLLLRDDDILYELIPNQADPPIFMSLPSGTEAIHFLYNK
ncbi:MAG: hypothetical protein HKN32_04620, partial [Flavobacteriales bacterium]|nr:hypothetical protein [Flavobacteriales bacterium]